MISNKLLSATCAILATASASFADTIILSSNPADRHVRDDGYKPAATDATVRVNNQFSAMLVFDLSSIDLTQLESASLSVVINEESSIAANVDVYGLGFTDAATTLPTNATFYNGENDPTATMLINNFVVTADYNNDGKHDLFTYNDGGVMVYKNTSTSTSLDFSVAAFPGNSICCRER